MGWFVDELGWALSLSCLQADSPILDFYSFAAAQNRGLFFFKQKRKMAATAARSTYRQTLTNKHLGFFPISQGLYGQQVFDVNWIFLESFLNK